MEYLLTVVDRANLMLNGEATSSYASDPVYATKQAVDIIAVNQAVETLIKKQIKPEFFVTTTSSTSSFSFQISAKGTYLIDWGDGDVETINKTNTTNTTYSHTYDSAGEYTIGIGGEATAYNTGITTSAISFKDNINTAGISGSLGAIFGTLSDGTQPIFFQTFYNNTNLTGEIPADLFAGISGKPAFYMFYGTFSGCSGLTGTIPENLFAGISGTPASYMFSVTFLDCSGLTGTIPENLFAGILFAGISGTPATSMFASTFNGCSGLTGTIPENLFGDLSGAPAYGMFSSTFEGCSGLTGSIPENLFAGISGKPAGYMFYRTFYACSGLTGEIPLGLFGNLTNRPQSYMFGRTFYGCSGLTGPSARMPDGTYLYDFFTGATTSHVRDMYSGATGLDDYPYIPTIWGGLGQEKPESKFFVTTTPNTSSFEFDIGAAGNFTIDWGDGDVETINKTDATNTTYSHTYDSAGEYTIGIGGEATAYNTSTSTAAISFSNNKNTAGISGSLGAIFGTLSDGTQPIFYQTFYNNTNLTGEIPADLFAGISGAPASSMFSRTFYNCSGLTGTIPENLFAGISGTPASYMFSGTFNGCRGLTGTIPENLFAGISGTPASSMFERTFNGCRGLTGTIPENLFGDLSGAPAYAMFDSTFYGCSGLTGEIPLGLFGNLTNRPQWYMFRETFYGCSGLTGPSARMPDGTYLYDFFTGATETEVGDMYQGATGLSDYSSIPTAWK